MIIFLIWLLVLSGIAVKNQTYKGIVLAIGIGFMFYVIHNNIHTLP
jgi:hypothetical protein